MLELITAALLIKILIAVVIIAPPVLMYGTTSVAASVKNKTLAGRYTVPLPAPPVAFYSKEIPTSYLNKFYNKHLPLTVADFYWAASWKSYLPGSATYGVATQASLTNALLHNARVIHLDVYSSNRESNYDKDADPVVRPEHFMAADQPLAFADCIALIAEEAWATNSHYPLLLSLSLNFGKNKFILAKMAATLREKFGEQLLDKKYGFNGRGGRYPLGAVPIEEMLGKVALIVDDYPNAGSLDELTNGVASSDQEFVKLIEYDESTAQYGGLGAVMSDMRGLVEHNRTNLSYVAPQMQHNALAVVDGGVDLFNPDAADARKYGCQLVFMNYQTSDEAITLVHKFFVSGGLQLKPDNLRNVPKPPPKVVKQKVALSYAPQTVSVHGGWGTLKL